MEPKKVADALGQSFASISANNSYPREFQNIKMTEESRHLNIGGGSHEPYNDQISLPELQVALQSTRNTASGDDGIYYQMLKNLPLQTLRFLLKIFNKCW